MSRNHKGGNCVDDKDMMRPIKTIPDCTLGAQTGPQTIVVRQVVARR